MPFRRGSRRGRGFWPPSWARCAFAPERDKAPLWPRPLVLPCPEPVPRPTRLRERFEPGAGERSLSLILLVHLLDVDQVAHLVEHAPNLGRIPVQARVPDPLQAQGADRPLVVAPGADDAL